MLATALVVLVSSHLVAAVVPIWGQCGGDGYTGDNVCTVATMCTALNQWYSQCIPCSVQTPSSSSTTSTSTLSSTTISSISPRSASTTSSSTSPSGTVTSEGQTWKNAVIGAGGFVPGIIFSPVKKGLCYIRTDIGGAYRLSPNDDSWIPITDFAADSTWHNLGIEGLAADPVDPNIVYLAVGMYTNSWDPNNGSILKSTDQGNTWTSYDLPFKVGGNMPGRGLGERLAIDPNNNSILYFGARSGNGLWKSTNAGVSWAKVNAFPDSGTYIPDPSNTGGVGAEKIGITWVTFDNTTKTSTGSSRIFVGVASLGAASIYQTTDGGNSWTALPIFNNAFIPHKGVHSPKEGVLYVTFANGAGPNDGSSGRIGKFTISAGTWKDITPAQAISDNGYGFGGLAIDLNKPGTIMAAALNEWWPDANIYRSLDGGTTWSAIWEWGGYPTINRHFGVDYSLTPWLGHPLGNQDISLKLVGWWIEAMVIDPFDSNHWLYGTGASVIGGHDLLNWDTTHNVTLKSMAAGIEETSVQGLISPPTGHAHLLSVVSDIGGFLHTSLSSPTTAFATPSYGSTTGIDYAGNKPNQIVRVGNNGGDSNPQVALSTDYGATWTANSAAPAPSANSAYAGGQIAYSANGDTLLWSNPSLGVLRSSNQASFTVVSALPSGAAIAADKVSGTALYAASGNKFYASADTGATWTSVAVNGLNSAFWIAVNPFKAGDLWVSGAGGIFRSTDFGKTFSALPGPNVGWRIAVGASKTAGGTPALYAAASIGGVNTLYRTDDQRNWLIMTDAAHGFGATSSLILAADPRIYKRVYVGTNGRGIFYNSNAA